MYYIYQKGQNMWKWEEIQKLLWKKSVIARVTEINKVNINIKTH